MLVLRIIAAVVCAAVAPVASFVVLGGGSWLWTRAVGRLPELVLQHVALWGVAATVAVAALAWRGCAHAPPRVHRLAGWWLVIAVVARFGDGFVWNGPLVAVEHHVDVISGLVADEQRQDGAGWGAHDGNAGLERRTTIPCRVPGQRAAVVVRRVADTHMQWRDRRLVLIDDGPGTTAEAGSAGAVVEAVVDVFAPCAVHRGNQGVRFTACDGVDDDEALRIGWLRGRVAAGDIDVVTPCGRGPGQSP